MSLAAGQRNMIMGGSTIESCFPVENLFDWRRRGRAALGILTAQVFDREINEHSISRNKTQWQQVLCYCLKCLVGVGFFFFVGSYILLKRNG